MKKNNVSHFEIYADDPEKLGHFYTGLFDWNLRRGENQSGGADREAYERCEIERQKAERDISTQGRLFVFHHDPDHDDATIDQMVEHARRLVMDRRSTLQVEAAREGGTVVLP